MPDPSNPPPSADWRAPVPSADWRAPVPYGFTVADCVAANARAFGDRVAIEVLDPRRAGVEPVDVWTYDRLWRRVQAVAAALDPVTPGPHGPMVAVLLGNTVDALVSNLAAQVAGAAAVPVNNRLAAPEVEFVLRDSGATVLLTGDGFEATARVAAESVAHAVRLIDTGLIDTGGIAGAETGVPAWSGPSVREAAERLAFVAYTSGTTGFPKGSVVTNAGFLMRFSQWAWTFGLSPSQVLSTPGPVFHMSYGGLSLAHLVGGGRIRLMLDFDPDVALVEYAEHSSWVFLVPSMLAMIAERWETAGRPELARLEWMLSSGAPGPLSLLDRAFDVFPRAKICEAYGWSEGGWVTYEVKQRDDLVPHSVGWTMLGTELEVRNDSGERCSPGEPGEVVVRSITPFGGYLGNAAATDGALTSDGFCRSGDVGLLDETGRLHIVDRVKDMVISGGENVYCAEVERILVDHPDVVEAAVFGLPDETWGERVTAAVVVRAGATPTAEEVIAHCRAELAAYKCPKQVETLAELPRNPMGKVQKFRLIEQFGP